MRFRIVLLALSMGAASLVNADSAYFPERFDWQHIEPEAAGFDPEALTAAVSFARERAETEPKELRDILLETYTDREPNYRVLGPDRKSVV